MTQPIPGTWLDLFTGTRGPTGDPGAPGLDATQLAILPFKATLATLGYGGKTPITTEPDYKSTSAGTPTATINFTIPADTTRGYAAYIEAHGVTNSWIVFIPPGLYRRTGSANVTTESAAVPLTGVGLLAGCSVAVTTSGDHLVLTLTGPASNVSWAVWSQLMDLTPIPATPQAPVISSFSPASLPLAGATGVVVNGANFVAPLLISVDGGATFSAVTSFTNSSAFVEDFGAHAAGNISVVVKNPDLQTSAPVSLTYSAAAAPTLSTLTPNSVGTAGGTIVFAGANFVATPQVSYDNGATWTSTGVTFNNAGQLTVATGTLSAGSLSVKVRNPDLQVSAAVTLTVTSVFDAQAAFGSSHVKRWGRADDSYTHAGSPARVSVMGDKTSNAYNWNDSVAVNQGRWTAADVNGLASLTFSPTGGSASGPILYGTDNAVTMGNLHGTAAAFTEVFVIQVAAAANNDATNASGGDGILEEAVGLYYMVTAHNRGGTGNVTIVGTVFTSAYHNFPDVVIPINTWCVLTVRYDGTSYYVGKRLPGVAFTETSPVTAGAIPSAGRSGAAWVGKGVGTTRYFNGKIAEEVFTDNDLGFSTLKTSVVDVLATMYGIT